MKTDYKVRPENSRFADRDNRNIGDSEMEINSERRRERRLRYQWPVWFAEDFDGLLKQGQMIDVSSNGAAFTCFNDHEHVYCGQQLTARFSIPRFAPGDAFDMEDYVRKGWVCRVDQVNRFLRRVAIQFAEPLPFKPGEQSKDEADEQARLMAVTI